MNSLWVGRIAHPKKRLVCETGIGKDWKSEKWEEDFKTDEECVAALLERSNSPQENGTAAIHPPTHKYTYSPNSLASQRAVVFCAWKQVIMMIELADQMISLILNLVGKFHDALLF